MAEFAAMSVKADAQDRQKKPEPEAAGEAREAAGPSAPKEIGGRDGPEPTRFGDWEKGGRCIDF